jgi:hypothetical protein
VPLHAYTSKAAEKHTGEFVCNLQPWNRFINL